MTNTFKIIMTILNILMIIFFMVILFFNVHNVISEFFAENGKAIRLFGFSHQIIQSNSENFDTGDYVVFQKQKHYLVGDIVRYQENKELIIQPITQVTQNGYLLKDTQKLSSSQIIGKSVFTIPQLGKLLLFLRTPIGMLLLVLCGAFVFAFPKLISIIFNPKRKKSYSMDY